MDLGRIEENQLLQWLSWYDAVGSEEIIEEEATNWFDRSQKQLSHPQQRPAASQRPQANLVETSAQHRKQEVSKARVAEHVTQISRQAGQASSLEALHQKIKDFNGWSLHKTARHFFTGIGPTETPEYLIFVEAPGETEERSGEPFTGLEATLLRNYMQAANFRTEESRLNYVLPYRPPGDQISHIEWFEMVSPFLHRQITLMQPKSIICFSTKTAAQLLRLESNISATELRRQKPFYQYEKSIDSKELNDIPLLCLPSLKELLEVPSKKKQVWKETLKFITNKKQL